MFRSFTQNRFGKSPHSVLLQVESLEDRNMPSTTMPVLVHSSLQAEWPPPPAMQMTTLSLGREISGSHTEHDIAVWPPPPPNSLAFDSNHGGSISINSTEEIPQ